MVKYLSQITVKGQQKMDEKHTIVLVEDEQLIVDTITNVSRAYNEFEIE